MPYSAVYCRAWLIIMSEQPPTAGPSRRARNPTVIDLTDSPVSPFSPSCADDRPNTPPQPTTKLTPPRPLLKRRFDKPSPVNPKGKGKEIATAPSGLTLIVRGLGPRGVFDVPAFCSLTEMIATVNDRVAEIMGPGVGEISGLIVPAGTIDEKMWNGRCRVGKLTVALVWAWSS